MATTNDDAYKYSVRDDTSFRVSGDNKDAYKFSVRDDTSFRVSGGGADSDVVGTGQVDFMVLKS